MMMKRTRLGFSLIATAMLLLVGCGDDDDDDDYDDGMSSISVVN